MRCNCTYSVSKRVCKDLSDPILLKDATAADPQDRSKIKKPRLKPRFKISFDLLRPYVAEATSSRLTTKITKSNSVCLTNLW